MVFRLKKQTFWLQGAKRSAKLVLFSVLYKFKDCHVASSRSCYRRLFATKAHRAFVIRSRPRNDVGVNVPRNDVEPEVLEQEAGVDVECAVSVLLVEAACILERHDEVLVHDEAEACAGCCMETVLA